ncbi:hypothetical protein QQ020_28995 [Fulvivirgaceae bacterium BMA12]|uniref:STAS/SEC14 domain-containing protein n=1 Tax=Agaribacillus aureus TaxID=3051825 RepID=A0ABT8LED1_9BACT|nr:hypothetical protein [Fulvivirgaceae bacterium BMA12]
MNKISEFKKADGHVYVEIYYDPEHHMVMDVWKGNFGTQENFRKGIMKAIEVIKFHGCRAWVGDLREMKGSFDSSNDWMFQTAVPQAKLYGLTRAAIIWPENVFSKLSAKDTMQKVGYLELRAFDKPEEAFKWVKADIQLAS